MAPLRWCWVSAVLCCVAAPLGASPLSWSQRIAFRDSMLNLEISRGQLRSAADSTWQGAVAYRPNGNPTDETHFHRFTAEYRGGIAVHVQDATHTGSAIPLYAYPPVADSRSLLLSLRSGWIRTPEDLSRTPAADLLRIVLEPWSDTLSAPAYSVQAIHGRLGTVTFGTRSHLALLLDGNRDGAYSRDLLDALYVDLNDDQHFDVDLASPECGPLRVPFAMDGSEFEAVTVARDGSSMLLHRIGPASPLALAKVGAPAPEFSLGGTPARRLSDLRGRPVVIFFWASWCSGCHAQALALSELRSRYRPGELAVVGVDLDSDQRAGDAFLATYGEGWVSVSTGREFWEDRTARVYGLAGPGVLFLVDAKGMLVARSSEAREIEQRVTGMKLSPATALER